MASPVSAFNPQATLSQPQTAAPATLQANMPQKGQLSRQQQQEIFRDRMIQKLQQQAEAPKSKGEAVVRNIFDGPMIAMDLIVAGVAWGIGALIKARGLMDIKRPWLALLYPVVGFAFRGVYSAVTGKVPAQQSAERSLQALGLPPASSSSPNATAGLAQTMPQPLATTAPQQQATAAPGYPVKTYTA